MIPTPPKPAPAPVPTATPTPAPIIAPKPPTTGELAAASVRWPLVISKDQFGNDHPAVVTRIAADDTVDMIVFNQNGTCIGRFKVVNGFEPGQWHTYDQPAPAYTQKQLANATASVASAQGEVDAAQDVIDNQQVPTTAAKNRLAEAEATLATAKKFHASIKGV